MAALFWSLLGVLAGAFIAVQATVNAQLGKALGLPIAAAAFSFLAGTVALTILTALFVRFQDVSVDLRAPAPWLFVTGGFLGAAYVTSTIILTPRLGAATVMAFLVAGQLLTGLFLDRIGFLDLAVREISVGRVAGALMLVGGALLIRLT